MVTGIHGRLYVRRINMSLLAIFYILYYACLPFTFYAAV